MKLLRDKRFSLTLAATLFLAFIFWTGSRYPDLDEKAEMASEMTMIGLSFDAPFRVDPNESVWIQIISETGNWLTTNKNGMFFCLAFATCLMTLFPFLLDRVPTTGFGNTLAGMLLGCPLGVCVNCATPIAKGLNDRGSRLEFSLSLLLSSPSFNVVVLTMMFALLPWYVAASKVIFTLLIILVGLPIICRTVSRLSPLGSDIRLPQQLEVKQTQTSPLLPSICDIGSEQSWSESFHWMISSMVKSAWLITRRTVPLMLIAGVLGAALSVLIPWDAVVNHLPGGSFAIRLLVLAGIAILGTFLPVPMAFDVILTVSLINAGLPMHHATTLFFTLGLFSIYPFLVIHRSISRRIALLLFAMVAGVGIINGVVNRSFQLWWLAHENENMIQLIQQLPPSPIRFGPERASQEIRPENEPNRFKISLPADTMRVVTNETAIQINRYPLQNRLATAQPAFTRIPLKTHGLDVPATFSLREWATRNQFYNRCITAADIHNDGWPDVAVSADHHEGGIYLFANLEGETFHRQHLDLGSLNNVSVTYLAFVDLTNDGWLDLFFATQDNGNHYIQNRSGSFHRSDIVSLPSVKHAETAAAAFADFNRDGRLDIYNGNWSLGPLAWGRGESISAKNQLLYSTGDGFEPHLEDSMGAATLSVLFTDLNADGLLDLCVGNDFQPVDLFSLGGQDGFTNSLQSQKLVIPHTTWSTMSLDSADLNNDLVPEIFIAQIARGRDSRRYFRKSIDIADLAEYISADEAPIAEELANLRTLGTLLSDRNAKRSSIIDRIDDPQLKADAISFVAIHSIARNGAPEMAEAVPQHATDVKRRMDRIFTPRNRASRELAHGEIPQIQNYNVLLSRTAPGEFEDIASPMGLDITGWTWNAKFADLDLDEWQDLYFVNGQESTKMRETNGYFRNQSGRTFKDSTEEAGLTDHFATSSYAYCDFDQDGDLDIITVPNSAPVRVWQNNSSKNHALVVELRDHLGNAFGVGSIVTVHYGPNQSKSQLREIKASGGFHSADAPIAHFGLGDHSSIGKLEIVWSTGERTFIDGPFSADSRLMLTRKVR